MSYGVRRWFRRRSRSRPALSWIGISPCRSRPRLPSPARCSSPGSSAGGKARSNPHHRSRSGRPSCWPAPRIISGIATRLPPTTSAFMRPPKADPCVSRLHRFRADAPFRHAGRSAADVPREALHAHGRGRAATTRPRCLASGFRSGASDPDGPAQATYASVTRWKSWAGWCCLRRRAIRASSITRGFCSTRASDLCAPTRPMPSRSAMNAGRVSLFGWLAMFEAGPGDSRRVSAGTTRRGGGLAPRRDFRDDPRRLGSLHAHRRAPRARHLGAAPGRPGRFPLVLVSAAPRAAAKRGIAGCLAVAGIRIADRRPAAVMPASVVLAYAGGILLPPRADGQYLRTGVAWRHGPQSDGRLRHRLSAVLPRRRRTLLGVGVFPGEQEDPLEKLIDESRSWLEACTLKLLRGLGWLYAVTALVWLAVSPLLAAQSHLVRPSLS